MNRGELEDFDRRAEAERALRDMPSPLAAAIRALVIAEYEKERGKAIRAALAEARAERRKTGGRHAPYGFRAIETKSGVKRLVRLPGEQRAIELMTELRGIGATLQHICDALRERGYRPRGKAWYPATVRSLLARAPSGAP